MVLFFKANQKPDSTACVNNDASVEHDTHAHTVNGLINKLTITGSLSPFNEF